MSDIEICIILMFEILKFYKRRISSSATFYPKGTIFESQPKYRMFCLWF